MSRMTHHVVVEHPRLGSALNSTPRFRPVMMRAVMIRVTYRYKVSTVQSGPLRGPVGALPRNPMVQCGFEKIAGLGVD